MKELDPFKYPQRRWKNYLLDPHFQIRHSAHLFWFGFVAALILQWLMLDHLRDVLVKIHEQLPGNSEVLGWFDPSVMKLAGMFIGFVAIFSVSCFAFGILITHRIVGPVIALKRHVGALANGNYRISTRLRRKDYLVELAKALNDLSTQLERRHGSFYLPGTAERGEPAKSLESDRRDKAA